MKYKLVKDLPYFKAGIIYSLNKDNEYGCDNNTYLPDIGGCKREKFGIHRFYVEENPEWFEPVPEGLTDEKLMEIESLVSEKNRLKEENIKLKEENERYKEMEKEVVELLGILKSPNGNEVILNEIMHWVKYILFKK